MALAGRHVLFISGVALFTLFLFYKSAQHRSPAPSSTTLDRLYRSEKNWQESVKKRHDFMAKLPSIDKFNPWGDKGFTVVWNLFAPTFDCPHSKERVGAIGDGGKWVCGMELFEASQQPCVVYSFGVNRESSFEAEVLDRLNCEIFAYDMTVDKMGPQIHSNPRAHFQKIGLGSENTDNLKTLQTHMEENGHAWIDILKVDIEGAEFGALDNVMNTFQDLPFGQLQVEVHLHKSNFPKLYNWFERLESSGLRAFSSELNLVTCVKKTAMKPTVIEYSFLNVKINHTVMPISLVY